MIHKENIYLANRSLEKDRMIYPDIIRIISIFFIIVLHVSVDKWSVLDINSYDWQILNFYLSISRWSVPMFVMISGMFLLDNEKIYTYKKLFFGNILRISIALLFWGFLYNMVYLIFSEKSIKFSFLLDSFKAIISGDAWGHLWFLYMLIGLYIITPVLRIFISKASRNDLEYFLLIAFLFGSLLPALFQINALKILSGSFSKMDINFVAGFVGCYVSGYYFKKYKINKLALIIIYMLGFLSLIFTITITSILSLSDGAPNAVWLYFTGPNVFITSIAIFLFFKNYVQKINFSKKAERIIFLLSRCSFGIYLIHMFFHILINKIGLTNTLFNPLFSVIVMVIIIYLLSFLAIFLIKKMPYLNRYIV